MQRPKQIGIAIVKFDGCYLVGVRGPDVPLAGCAEFPGGKCLPAETPTDCAVRECLEETGLAVTPVKQILRVQHEYPHGQVDLHFVLCQPVNNGDVVDDHGGFRWVPRATLQTFPFPEANQGVIPLLD